jgi:hypothetical protein
VNQPTPNRDTTAIEAVPTFYAGTDFRSALEADWAATLNRWGIAWQYEPETITLPSGAVYLPDFWLPSLGTWLEVKGPGIPRIEKAIELGETRACHCDGDCTCQWPGGELVLIGHPPKRYAPGAPRHHRDIHGGHPNWTTVHGRTWFGRCQSCRHMGWWNRQVCRACGRTSSGGHAYFSASRELEFVSSAGIPSRNLSAAAREVLAALDAGRRPDHV